jgi:hypothetical protein
MHEETCYVDMHVQDVLQSDKRSKQPSMYDTVLLF